MTDIVTIPGTCLSLRRGRIWRPRRRSGRSNC